MIVEIFKKTMKPLKELSRIDFGCYDSALSKGEILYLQLKNFDENNQFLANVDAFVEEDEKYNKNLLLENDILLPSKGTRIFATLFRAQWGKAVASSIFYVLRVDSAIVLPAYLATILNLPQYQQQLWQMGGGSNIFSLRKKELEDLQIPIPPLKIQQQISDLNLLFQQKNILRQQMIQKERQLYQSIIHKLIS